MDCQYLEQFAPMFQTVFHFNKILLSCHYMDSLIIQCIDTIHMRTLINHEYVTYHIHISKYLEFK